MSAIGAIRTAEEAALEGPGSPTISGAEIAKGVALPKEWEAQDRLPMAKSGWVAQCRILWAITPDNAGVVVRIAKMLLPSDLQSRPRPNLW